MSKKINIRPTTSVYATYKNIKYDPWTAIAEFVDNSTQSYYDHIKQLEDTKYWDGLDVYITYERNSNGDKLVIRDNAFGMDFHDFQRAIMLDSPPKKPTRSEFGMGLKTAACWFGLMWSVESTELGSGIKFKATVDVETLRKYKNEEISVEEIQCKPKEHGTVITIWNLNRTMSSRQIGKTKDQLRGMYRVDLRTNKIHIYYNDEKLQYEMPKILEEVLPNGRTRVWKKDISFSVLCNGNSYPVNGFVALLDEGSVSGAGLTLIRRGRVIIGGYENGYRPEEVFEKSNSFVYQRLFGELNMDEWPVTQTKDSFDWYSGLEDLFIEHLLTECDELRKKAKTYRKSKPMNVQSGFKTLVQNFKAAGIINDVNISELPEHLIDNCDENEGKEAEIDVQGLLYDESEEDFSEDRRPEVQIEGTNGKTLSFVYEGENFTFNYILKNQDPDAGWLNIINVRDNEYNIEWNIRHPFFKPYSEDPKFLELMQQFTFALALSEIGARQMSVNGLVSPSAIRTKMNEALKAVIQEQ